MLSVANKAKIYHAYMLKLYHERKEEKDEESPTIMAAATYGKEEVELPSVDDLALLELETHQQKESVNDIKLGPELTDVQISQLKKILDSFTEVF